MSNQSRKQRGYTSQRIAADWYVQNGWEYAVSTGAGRAGVDITGMPGLAPEVKARRALNITGWLKQASQEKRLGLPFVIVRPDGFGEARIGQWAVLMTLEDHTALLKMAGYARDARVFGSPESVG